MGRIVSSVTIDNLTDPGKSLRCDALVDTGTAYLVLPNAWRERLGSLETVATIELETATQSTVEGKVCGPVRIQLEGFRPIYSELIFVEKTPVNGGFEPLIGYLVLEQSSAAVDTLGHRLVHLKRVDLKICAVIDELFRTETRSFPCESVRRSTPR